MNPSDNPITPIILDYLESTYKFDYKLNYIGSDLIEKPHGNKVSIGILFPQLRKIFNVDNELLHPIFDMFIAKHTKE